MASHVYKAIRIACDRSSELSWDRTQDVDVSAFGSESRYVATTATATCHCISGWPSAEHEEKREAWEGGTDTQQPPYELTYHCIRRARNDDTNAALEQTQGYSRVQTQLASKNATTMSEPMKSSTAMHDAVSGGARQQIHPLRRIPGTHVLGFESQHPSHVIPHPISGTLPQAPGRRTRACRTTTHLQTPHVHPTTPPPTSATPMIEELSAALAVLLATSRASSRLRAPPLPNTRDFERLAEDGEPPLTLPLLLFLLALPLLKLSSAIPKTFLSGMPSCLSSSVMAAKSDSASGNGGISSSPDFP